MGPDLEKKNVSLAERIRQRNVKNEQIKFFNKIHRKRKSKRKRR